MSTLRVSTGTPVVIDSSVAAKWFLVDEPGADEARRLLLSHAEDEVALIAPALLPLEVLNALIYRGADSDDARRAVQLLEDADLLVAPLDAWLLQQAVDVAADASVTMYDALFIALAEQLDATLVTADRRQASTERCKVQLVG